MFTISNLGQPQHSEVIERLSKPDKIRLAEFSHLRQSLGDAVWPGFGEADIPTLLYNEQYAFLLGYPDPAEGWIKVPAGIQRGGPWEAVANDTLKDELYYRQILADENVTPEAFTVNVGDRWAASLQTLDWMKISLLQPDLVLYEQQREWIEGLARYAEIETWRLAVSEVYTPLAETAGLKDFKQYRGFENRWSREIQQMSKMAGDHGDGRFYYSGMAQAFLIDRLMPGWKDKAFAENVWLEDLVTEAVHRPTELQSP